jgi:ribosomal protein S18 acetylase RimI-like enzyme
MKLDDVATVHALGSNTEEFKVNEKSSSVFWPLEVLEELVQSEQDQTLVAERRGEIVSYIIVTYHPKTKKATWENAYVKPEHRGKELASKLYVLAEDRLISLGAKYICGLVERDNSFSSNMLLKNRFGEGKTYIWMQKEV